MEQIPATLGGRSGPTVMIGFSVFGLIFVAKAIGAFARGDIGWATGDTLVAALGVAGAVKAWMHWSRGGTRLSWDGDNSQITHGDRTIFDGPLDSIGTITEDGRGYFLHLDSKHQIRLRRQDVPQQLAAALDNQIAQQASDGDA